MSETSDRDAVDQEREFEREEQKIQEQRRRSAAGRARRRDDEPDRQADAAGNARAARLSD